MKPDDLLDLIEREAHEAALRQARVLSAAAWVPGRRGFLRRWLRR